MDWAQQSEEPVEEVEHKPAGDVQDCFMDTGAGHWFREDFDKMQGAFRHDDKAKKTDDIDQQQKINEQIILQAAIMRPDQSTMIL